MAYTTIDYLRDLTPTQISGAQALIFTPYIDDGLGQFVKPWESTASVNFTDYNKAPIGLVYSFSGIANTTYDFLSSGYNDPVMSVVYDNFGNAIESNKEIDDQKSTVDAIFDWVAPYTGTYFFDPSWHQDFDPTIDVLLVRKHIYKELTVISFSPTDGATAAAIDTNIVIAFSEAIQKGIGTIDIHIGSETGPIKESFNVEYSSKIVISGNTVTIDPHISLSDGAHYFVTFDPGIVKSLGNNSYAGTVAYDFFTQAISVMETGTEEDDYFSGAANDDDLEGWDGNDELDGRAGNDLLDGGDGNDNLIGGDGNDKLIGGDGNDALNGGTGNDIMEGGAGNDLYYIDSLKDSPLELSNEGIDTVKSSITYALKNGFENLILTGKSEINGTGNGLNNTLTGNVGINQLIGGAGADKLIGGLSNDILTGGAGKDIFRFEDRSKDTIKDFSVKDDTIQLENSSFTKLAKLGVLNAANFKIGAGAADKNDFIVYNSKTGALFYDDNGNGAGHSTQIAIIGTHLALTNADFVIT